MCSKVTLSLVTRRFGGCARGCIRGSSSPLAPCQQGWPQTKVRLESSTRESRDALSPCIWSFPTVGLRLSPRAWELVWVLTGEGDPCFLAGDLFTDIMSTLTIRQPIIGLIAKLYLSFIGAGHAVQKLHMLFLGCPRVTYAVHTLF